LLLFYHLLILLILSLASPLLAQNYLPEMAPTAAADNTRVYIPSIDKIQMTEPIKLEKMEYTSKVYETEQDFQYISCPSDQYRIFAESKFVESWTKNFKPVWEYNESLKSTDAVISYMNCYKSKTDTNSTQFANLLKMSELVAQTYGIPQTMLLCMMYIESKLNPNPPFNPSTAKGIAQITDGTLSFINGLKRKPKNFGSCLNSKKFPNKEELINDEKPCISQECLYCRTLYERELYAQKWEELQKKAAKDQIPGGLPATIDRTNPLQSVAAMGMLLHYMFNETDRTLNKSTDGEWKKSITQDITPLTQLVASSYNMGQGRASSLFLQAIKVNGKSQDISELVNYVARKTDNGNYHKKFTDCATSGCYKTVIEGEKPHQKICEEKNGASKNVAKGKHCYEK